jgi:hypothetical protein
VSTLYGREGGGGGWARRACGLGEEERKARAVDRLQHLGATPRVQGLGHVTPGSNAEGSGFRSRCSWEQRRGFRV